MYFYNSAQRYEQFLQVGGLYRALILLGLALCLPTASVSSVLMVLSIYLTFFNLRRPAATATAATAATA